MRAGRHLGSAGGPNPKALPMRESFNRDNVIIQHCPAALLSRGRPHARKSNAHTLTSARLFESLSCAGTLAAMLGTSSGQRLPHFLRGGLWPRRGGASRPGGRDFACGGAGEYLCQRSRLMRAPGGRGCGRRASCRGLFARPCRSPRSRTVPRTSPPRSLPDRHER